MKIFFILRSVAIYGGVERVVVDKMNYLAEKGHKVTLITYEQGIHPCVYQLNSRIFHVDVACPYYTLYRYSLLFRIVELWKMVYRFKKRLYSLAKAQNPDVIVSVSNACEYLQQVMNTPCGKKIWEAHGAYPAIMSSATFTKKIKNYLSLRSIRRSNLIITLTDSDRSYWMKLNKQTLVVPNPLAFYPENINGFERKKGRILCVARLEQQKRIDRLIDAFALIAERNSTWYIDVYGDGQERESLMKQIDRLNLTSRIHLNPPTNDINQEYLSSQMTVLSSDYEGFGLVIIESMACGTPVISTNCPFGPSDIIKDGEDGLLCEMTVKDLACKMEWMITHEDERMAMALKAHRAAERYRKDNVMKQWENAYMTVVR